MREREIEQILVREVKGLGGRAYKWVSPGNDGVPDRIVILPGRNPVFVEVKTERGRLSSLQKIQLDRLRKLEQDTAVVKGVKGVSEFFKARGYGAVGKYLDHRYGLRSGS